MEFFNPSYIGERNDILELIPCSAKRVLDIGCSIGTLGKSLKARQDVEVIGIEYDKEMAKIAEKYLDKIIIGDLDSILLPDLFSDIQFDCIVFADVLEHLKDPWSIVQTTHNLLREKGVVIISVPNVRHYTTILNLLIRGYWPYRERGIHDKNHLRFFTLKNIKDMLQQAGLEILKIERSLRIIERPHPYNKYSRYLDIPVLNEFLTFQYIILSQKH